MQNDKMTAYSVTTVKEKTKMAYILVLVPLHFPCFKSFIAVQQYSF